MDGDLWAEVLVAQRRTLDVPAWPPAAPGTVPARLVGLTRPALPQGEVQRIFLTWIINIGIILLAGDDKHLVARQSG